MVSGVRRFMAKEQAVVDQVVGDLVRVKLPTSASSHPTPLNPKPYTLNVYEHSMSILFRRRRKTRNEILPRPAATPKRATKNSSLTSGTGFRV